MLSVRFDKSINKLDLKPKAKVFARENNILNYIDRVHFTSFWNMGQGKKLRLVPQIKNGIIYSSIFKKLKLLKH